MSADMRELILAGAHFGHRTRFWNPKMEPFIYSVYNRTHIINLDHTVAGMRRASRFFEDVGATGGSALYVCAKSAGSEIVREEAERAGMPFVDHRWLGGLLTNSRPPCCRFPACARLRKASPRARWKI